MNPQAAGGDRRAADPWHVIQIYLAQGFRRFRSGRGAERGRARARFVEKPRSELPVNGGFFCFEPSVLELLDDESVLEREPLSALAGDGELRAFHHDGFWDCMDTYKDAVLLNDLWEAGRAPWKLWK